ncbi:MAG TPA: methylglyoxal synthase [Abditibacteriaceae bacterium]|jgi:methylglyoxal synthase
MIALIAHDHKKDDLIEFCRRHRTTLAHHELVATGTTGRRIHEATALPLQYVNSGPLGGDAQIAARVCEGLVEAVIFLVDPLYSHPHEPDVQGLLRICNLSNVPLATNLATAEMIIDTLAMAISPVAAST